MAIEINHPLLKHKLTVLRDEKTGHKEFRELVSEITLLIAYEAFKDIDTVEVPVKTPVADAVGKALKREIIVVPVLRAGVGMLDGILTLLPNARVGFVGLYRDPESKKPVEYYEKFPEQVKDPEVVIIDPMLATGGSTVAAIDLIKKKAFKRIRVISVIAAPEGIEVVEKKHPDVPIFTGNIDDYLNEHKYIVPGLGDAGDRLYGTR